VYDGFAAFPPTCSCIPSSDGVGTGSGSGDEPYRYVPAIPTPVPNRSPRSTLCAQGTGGPIARRTTRVCRLRARSTGALDATSYRLAPVQSHGPHSTGCRSGNACLGNREQALPSGRGGHFGRPAVHSGLEGCTEPANLSSGRSTSRSIVVATLTGGVGFRRSTVRSHSSLPALVSVAPPDSAGLEGPTTGPGPLPNGPGCCIDVFPPSPPGVRWDRPDRTGFRLAWHPRDWSIGLQIQITILYYIVGPIFVILID